MVDLDKKFTVNKAPGGAVFRNGRTYGLNPMLMYRVHRAVVPEVIDDSFQYVFKRTWFRPPFA